jgi:hypothetical protein
MPESELFLLFVRRFNAAGIRYMIGGSVAAIFYGKPRYTHDVDCVAFLNDAEIRRFSENFPPSDFYLPPPEVIAAEVARERHGHFNIIHMNSTFKADVYPTGRDEFNAWAFRRRNPVPFEGEALVLAPVEYVIVRKLEFFREGGSEKHLKDIQGILEISGSHLDRSALAEWVCRQGVEAQWRLVQD